MLGFPRVPQDPTGPYGPWAHMGPGPMCALGPYGPRAHMGPGPIWAQGPYGPVGSCGTLGNPSISNTYRNHMQNQHRKVCRYKNIN